MILYYITDRRGFRGTDAEQRRALLRRVAVAARAGVDWIQLREKDLSARELERLARQALRETRNHSSTTRLLINGRSDVAIACEADGVHLRSDDLAASEVRTLWAKACARVPLIGVSAHTVEDVRYAEAHGADFAVLAPIFEKVQSGAAGIGIGLLKVASCGPQAPGKTEATPRSHLPLLALGGVNLGNAGACLAAGAAGVAGIRLFQEGDITENVRHLRQLALESRG